MEEGIICSFPVDELNVVFGGVRERNTYYFYFNKVKPLKKDRSAELVKDFPEIEANTQKVLQKLIEKITAKLKEQYCGERFIVLNQNHFNEEVRAYFSSTDINLDEIYATMDIIEFLNVLEDNPVTAGLNRKIRQIEDANGTLFVFSLEGQKRDIIDTFNSCDTPREFTDNVIQISVCRALFDYIKISRTPGSYMVYRYPFFRMDRVEFRKALAEKRVTLGRALYFEIEKFKKDDELKSKGIIQTYSFTTYYNILYDNLLSPY